VSNQTPTLTWTLATGFTGAQVTACADRACSDVIFQQNVSGTSLPVGIVAPLETGFVYWNVATLDAAGTPTPLVSATWQFEVPNNGTAPGVSSWPEFGDVNGDGYADVLFYAGAGDLALPGSSGGLVSPGTGVGWSLATGGCGSILSNGIEDVTGDGFADVILSCGAVYVFPGSADGPSSATVYKTEYTGAGNPIVVELFMGDLNGDGYADGVWEIEQGGATSFLELDGSPTGLVAAATPFIANYPSNVDLLYPIGDVNADGYADALFVDQNTNNASVYLGSSAGLSPTAALTLTAPAGFSKFGFDYGVAFVSGAGLAASDVDGDGYLDLVVSGTCDLPYFACGPGGAQGYDNVLFVYLNTQTAALFPSEPSQTITLASVGVGLANYTNNFYALAGGADVNGDGFGDVVATANWGWTQSGMSMGNTATVYFLGGPSGLGGTANVLLPPAANLGTGRTVALPGDVNGDGIGDLVTSWSNNPAVYLGAATISETPQAFPSSVEVSVYTPMY
jgi:hypothetical protein